MEDVQFDAGIEQLVEWLKEEVASAEEEQMNEHLEAEEPICFEEDDDSEDSSDEDETENESDEEFEQVGGARVKVLNVRRGSAGGEYSPNIKIVKLSVKLLSSITVDPDGAENFGEMVVEMVKKYKPTDANSESRVGVTFKSPELDSGEAIGLSITPIHEVSVDKIVQTMELLTQSSKSPLEIQDPKIEMVFKYITPHTGSGKRDEPFGMRDILEQGYFEKKRRRVDEDKVAARDANDFLDEAAEAEESEESDFEMDVDGEIVENGKERSNIMRNDVTYDCLPHALYQAWMYHEMRHGKTLDQRAHATKMYRASVEKSEARPRKCSNVYAAVRDMKKEARVTKTRDFGVSDIEKFQETVFAGTHQIIVVVDHQKTPFYAGPFVGNEAVIALFLADDHYSGVRKLPALLSTKFYCALCDVRYGSIADHYSCPLRHRKCGELDCPESPDDLEFCCIKCTTVFRSKTCLENHLRKGPRGGKSRCDYTKKCHKCDEIYYNNKTKVTAKHECGTTWCERCQTRALKGHYCTLRPSKKNEAKLTRKRIYYDYESRAEEETGEQVPVLFMAVRCCPGCSPTMPDNLTSAKNTICEKCSPDGRFKVIESVTEDNRFVDVAEESTEWIFSKNHKGFVALAHNASGYDAQFILKNLVSSRKAAPKMVTAGSKIVYLNHKGVRLLDSLKYLTMSLRAVGKSFQIPTEKGDFPVHFIRPENYDYIGPIPDNEAYNLDNKPPAAKKKLVEYLEKERAEGKVFNFVEELFKYCFNDVFILASALTAFEKDFETVTNVCLFEESVTAASAAIKAYLRNHWCQYLPVVLDARPSASCNASVVSQKYLAWIAEFENIEIETSANNGERKIGDYHVDGFVAPCDKYPRGLVIEFFGCYWHAHSCRYSDQSMIGPKSGAEIRASDEKRIAFLKEHHDVRIEWECKVENQRRASPEMTEFFEDYEPLNMLSLEKALAGGRTEVFKLYVNNVLKVIKYGDVVSLYPTVMKHEEFPVGVPKNVSRNSFKVPLTEPDHITCDGFMSCRVSPPPNLKLPVIGIKTTGKLVFGLCLACAKTSNQGSCKHTDRERSFNGTYTTIELKKALECGYKITKVYHAVHYESWAGNDESGTGGLFTSYINEMMVQKIYASGWPADVNTLEEKQHFVDQYLEKEGIKLDDFSRFEKRSGARLAAKLLLNSLWGKFAQRVDRANTEVVNNPAKFWKMFYDTSIVMEDVWPINDTIMVRFRKQAETLKSLKTGAVHIAAYVTSYARLRLYRLMEKVGGDNIIYTDTDSIVYQVPEGCVDPLQGEIGPYLGQLTDELEGEMTEFVTIGPKTYCYNERSNSGEEKVVRKAKGISMTSEADKKITFKRMKKMVDEVLAKAPQRTTIEIPQQTMRRDKYHNVFVKKNFKKFRFTFNKRRILPDGSTLPFGYCDT